MNDWCSGMAAKNLKRRSELVATVGQHSFTWARRIHALSRRPGGVAEVIILNCSLLKNRSAKSPIIAFAHKKIHDAFTAVELLVSREIPMPAQTVIAQGGLFSGMYVYRDWVPDFLKFQPLRFFSETFARILGNKMNQLFRDMNCHPVFRRFRDVPSRKVYESSRFSGRAISGMTYGEFLEYTRKETQQSINAVERDIRELNKSLIIFPEGKYQHSGAVAKLNGFLMNVATESGHPIAAISQSYDELCPDSKRRIDAVLTVSWIEPGETRVALSKKTAAALQTGTAIVASQLIAWLLLQANRENKKEGITGSPAAPDAVNHLRLEFLRMCEEAKRSGVPMDPRLHDRGFAEDRFARFMRANGDYVYEIDSKIVINQKKLRSFSKSERTVNNLEWNKNNIIHLEGQLSAWFASSETSKDL